MMIFNRFTVVLYALLGFNIFATVVCLTAAWNVIHYRTAHKRLSYAEKPLPPVPFAGSQRAAPIDESDHRSIALQPARYNNAFKPPRLNGVTNVVTFPGKDIGAKINNAIAALPTVTVSTAVNGHVHYPYGTVFISATKGVQQYTTQIGNGGKTLLAFVNIICDASTRLEYIGRAADAIYALDPNGVNEGYGYPNSADVSTGGIYNCTLIAPPSVRAHAHAIHYGNITNYKIEHDTIMGYLANDDAAILVENTNYFTEQTNFHDTQLLQNLHGVIFNKHCGPHLSTCTNSFEHSRLNFYCNQQGTGGDCIEALNGASVQYETFALTFNVTGPNSNVFYVDARSSFYQNRGTILGECDNTGDTMLYVARGGTAELYGIYPFPASCRYSNVSTIVPGNISFLNCAFAGGNGMPNTNACPFQAGNYLAGQTPPFFGNIIVQNNTGSTCKTYPTFAMADLSNGKMTVGLTANTTINARGINKSIEGSHTTDLFAFRLVRPGIGCKNSGLWTLTVGWKGE